MLWNLWLKPVASYPGAGLQLPPLTLQILTASLSHHKCQQRLTDDVTGLREGNDLPKVSHVALGVEPGGGWVCRGIHFLIHLSP